MAEPSVWDILVGATAYGKMMNAEKIQQQRGQQFAQLSGQYGATLPPDQAGPTRPAGPDFWMQAAAVPGYQQMAAQMIGQQQAQQYAGQQAGAERDFWTKNERLTDVNNRAQQAQQWGSLSPFQAEQLSNQRRGQDLGQQMTPYQSAMLDLQGRQQAMAERAAQYGVGKAAGAMPGSELFDKQLTQLQAAQAGVNAVGKLNALWGSTPWGRDKEAMGAAEPYKASVMGALGVLQNTGALQEGDVKRFGELLQEPGFWASSKRRNATMKELEGLMMNQVEQIQGRNPNLPRSGGGGGGGLPEGFVPIGGR